MRERRETGVEGAVSYAGRPFHLSGAARVGVTGALG